MLLRKPLLRVEIDNREKRGAAVVAIICVKETISLCSRAIDQSILLKYLRGSCEFFVISSLAIIVLVVSQGPETYGPESREAVQTAIDILGVSKCRNFTNQEFKFTFDDLISTEGHINVPNPDAIQDFQDLDNAGRVFANAHSVMPRKCILSRNNDTNESSLL